MTTLDSIGHVDSLDLDHAALAALHAATDAWLDSNGLAAWLAAVSDEHEISALATIVGLNTELDDATAVRYARVWCERVQERIDTLSQAERVRMLVALGLSKPEVLARLGCTRQTYDSAIEHTRKPGRPRTRPPERVTCPECAHSFDVGGSR